MKINIIFFACFMLLTSCISKSDSTTFIERIFEFDIPDCYIELDNPKEKFNHPARVVIELQFEADCMWAMYKNQMIKPFSDCRKYYVGTTVWMDPAWQNDEKKAIMYLDLDSRVLHFEVYDTLIIDK